MTKAANGLGYRQLAATLRQEIRDGKIAPGDQLPSYPQLRERFDASPNVVRDAVKQLAHERLVEVRDGIGTFVLEPGQWTSYDAAELMQLVGALRDEVREVRARLDSIERRLP